MLWTEKYRPTKLSEIVGQEHFVMDAENWVSEVPCNMPNILVHGTSGTGKTTIAFVLAKAILGEEIDANFFEVNASDDRKLETVRTKIKDIAQSAVVGDNVPFRIILLDEMDGMTRDAQNAMKRIMEKYSSNIRFIITCNDRSKIIHALQSRCANYRFNPLPLDLVGRIAKQVLQKEGHRIPPEEELGEFIYSLQGDLRRTLTELQASIVSGTTLTRQIEKGLQEYEEIITHITNKNTNEALDKIHNAIYAGRSSKEICIGLHEYIIRCDMEAKMKLKFLRVIGEGEWRSTTMTPKLLASWMVGQLI